MGENVTDLMTRMGKQAKAAALELAKASTESKNTALTGAAAAIRDGTVAIKTANAKDMAAGKKKGLTASLLDRLLLDDGRIEGMAAGLEAIAQLNDPIGTVLEDWERPNGLKISRVRVPLGVIGIIYESRPNVTADAGALCLKSGNAAILRGGSESYHSSHAIMDCLSQGLASAGLPAQAIQMIPTTDRAAVGAMLKLSDYIDVIVPRGGKGLIERVTTESRIPLFKHLDGICHTYVHASADPIKALTVTLNAKMRRTGVCGATETLLIDRAAAKDLLPGILSALSAAGCEIRGDETTRELFAAAVPTTESDWGTEYIDAIISVKVVEGLDGAINHINNHGSHHTDAIIAEDADAAERFLNEVDSAICVHNTSTQYADGGEFGMGAEIGISTGKMHARGPVGVEQLTSFKYKVRGDGQTRP